MTEAHRTKIKSAAILNCLNEHVLGNRDMSATQISAGIALLRKVLPDLAAVQHSGDQDKPINHRVLVEFVRAQQMIGKPE